MAGERARAPLRSQQARHVCVCVVRCGLSHPGSYAYSVRVDGRQGAACTALPSRESEVETREAIQRWIFSFTNQDPHSSMLQTSKAKSKKRVFRFMIERVVFSDSTLDTPSISMAGKTPSTLDDSPNGPHANPSSVRSSNHRMFIRIQFRSTFSGASNMNGASLDPVTGGVLGARGTSDSSPTP